MKLDKSRELYERSKRSLAGGVSSNARLTELPFPLFFERGKGSRLYDVDGNEYIDYVMGRGPIIFGHSPDFLLEAVAREMEMGQIFAGQHELEIWVSETIQRIVPCAELVRYATTGTEAVQAALRVARAYTGRPMFIRFEGQFHGWMGSVFYGLPESQRDLDDDEIPSPVPSAAGVSPGAAREVIVLPMNDIAILRRALDRYHDQIAAIITVPVPHHITLQDGYLEEIRRLCDERGIVLIFDEVVTGFRLALGGGQEYTGVTSDLATFAKAVANGFPVSVIAGKREMMGLMEDGTVMQGGTINTNIMCMAAAEACLNKLMEKDGAVYKQLHETGAALMDGLRDLARKHERDLVVQGPGPFLDVGFASDLDATEYRPEKRNVRQTMYDRFCVGMLERGVRLQKGGAGGGSWFPSTAHTEQDIEQTLAAADGALASL